MSRKRPSKTIKLWQLLKRSWESNIRLNADKQMLRRTEAPYTGHLLTSDRLQLNPEKLRAIKEMPGAK